MVEKITPPEATCVFGNYIDVYDIAQAVEDGATVRIYYESRLAKVSLSRSDKVSNTLPRVPSGKEAG
jgi:type I site-specific restriction-modification system R (restriction) subunit